MGSSVNIALPSIGKEFAMDAVLLNWVATSYLIAAGMFLVPFGRIADIFGRKKNLYIRCIYLYNVIILIRDFNLLYLTYFFQSFARYRQRNDICTGVAILTSVFPAGERGKALGISAASVYLGLSLGPFLGGFLTQHFGWRSIFLANVHSA